MTQVLWPPTCGQSTDVALVQKRLPCPGVDSRAQSLVVELPASAAKRHADRAAIVAEWNSGGRPDMKYVKRQKLTYVEYFVRGLYNMPQLLYDALILRSISINCSIHNYDNA